MEGHRRPGLAGRDQGQGGLPMYRGCHAPTRARIAAISVASRVLKGERAGIYRVSTSRRDSSDSDSVPKERRDSRETPNVCIPRHSKADMRLVWGFPVAAWSGAEVGACRPQSSLCWSRLHFAMECHNARERSVGAGSVMDDGGPVRCVPGPAITCARCTARARAPPIAASSASADWARAGFLEPTPGTSVRLPFLCTRSLSLH